MLVKNIMSRNPLCVKPDASFGEIWELIFDKRVSGLPVVNEKKILLGIISEEDLIEKLYPSYQDYFFDPSLAEISKKWKKRSATFPL